MGFNVVVSILLVSPAFLAGCGGGLCNENIDQHGRYQIDAVDVYNQQSKFIFNGARAAYYMSTGACSGVDGIDTGALLELQATGSVSDGTKDCQYVTANVTSAPQQITLQGPSSDPYATADARYGDTFMYAVENVAVAGCTGVMVLNLFGGGAEGGLFSTPVEGDFPPAILYRLFLPSTGVCQPCDDNFVIQLTKL